MYRYVFTQVLLSSGLAHVAWIQKTWWYLVRLWLISTLQRAGPYPWLQQQERAKRTSCLDITDALPACWSSVCWQNSTWSFCGSAAEVLGKVMGPIPGFISMLGLAEYCGTEIFIYLGCCSLSIVAFRKCFLLGMLHMQGLLGLWVSYPLPTIYSLSCIGSYPRVDFARQPAANSPVKNTHHGKDDWSVSACWSKQ